MVMQPKYGAKDLARAQKEDMCLNRMIRIIKCDNPEKELKRNEFKRDGEVSLQDKIYFKKNEKDLEISSQGILLRKVKNEANDSVRKLVVVPKLYHFEIMHQAHDLSGHQGENKTIARIRQYAFPLHPRNYSSHFSKCQGGDKMNAFYGRPFFCGLTMRVGKKCRQYRGSIPVDYLHAFIHCLSLPGGIFERYHLEQESAVEFSFVPLRQLIQSGPDPPGA